MYSLLLSLSLPFPSLPASGRSCLKLYTDPEFFLRQWFEEERKLQAARSSTKRKVKRRRPKAAATVTDDIKSIDVKVFSAHGKEFGGATVRTVEASASAIQAAQSTAQLKQQQLAASQRQHDAAHHPRPPAGPPPSSSPTSAAPGSPTPPTGAARSPRRSVFARPQPSSVSISHDDDGAPAFATSPSLAVSGGSDVDATSTVDPLESIAEYEAPTAAQLASAVGVDAAGSPVSTSSATAEGPGLGTLRHMLLLMTPLTGIYLIHSCDHTLFLIAVSILHFTFILLSPFSTIF